MAVLNQSGRERTARVVIGVALALLAKVIWGTGGDALSFSAALSLIVLVAGLVAIVTGVIGWCPFYALLGVSTESDIEV
jgi:hypothetical protein